MFCHIQKFVKISIFLGGPMGRPYRCCLKGLSGRNHGWDLQRGAALWQWHQHMTTNQVNRVHWATKENRQKVIFWMFSVHGQNGLGSPWMGPGRSLFVTNPDLADILGDMDFILEIFIFRFVGFQISGFPGSQISKIWSGPGRAWAIWTNKC